METREVERVVLVDDGDDDDNDDEVDEEEEEEEEEEDDDDDDDPVELRGTQVVPRSPVLLNVSFAWPAETSNFVFSA